MLDRIPLLGRLFGDREDREPPTPRERARLEHRRRALKRDLRKVEKVLKRRRAPRSPKAEDPHGVRLAKEADSLREELASIEKRLAME